MNCILVDDEQLSIDILERLCHKRGIRVLQTFTNPMEAVVAINEKKPDFVLLDIQMDAMNGLDLAEQINTTTKIIFCTAYEKFAVKSYEFDAVDYLLKPISYSRFCIAIDRVENLLGITKNTIVPAIQNDYIFCKLLNSKSIIKIEVNSIDYIMSEHNVAHVHTSNGRKSVYATLLEMERRLPTGKFLHVHKSYIVPTRRIVQFNTNTVLVKYSSGSEVLQIAIGEKYKENIAAYIQSNSSSIVVG